MELLNKGQISDVTYRPEDSDPDNEFEVSSGDDLVENTTAREVTESINLTNTMISPKNRPSLDRIGTFEHSKIVEEDVKENEMS